MRIKLSSVFVEDQEKALRFYTEKLGFVKKTELPVGEFKWLTVGSPEDEIELLLEPNANETAKTYQKEIFKQGIPATAFHVDDIEEEYKRLKGLGVAFKSEPTAMGDVKIAVLNDTCGNFIQLYQN